MKLINLGAFFVLFSNLGSTIVFASPLEAFALDTRSLDVERSSVVLQESATNWAFSYSSSTDCPASGGHASGNRDICMGVGGNSISGNGTCVYTTWSGHGCTGSSLAITTGCNQVRFASVRVSC